MDGDALALKIRAVDPVFLCVVYIYADAVVNSDCEYEVQYLVR